MQPNIKEVTNSLARAITREYDHSIDIDNFSTKGDNKAFKEWLVMFEAGYLSESLNNWLTNNLTPFTSTFTSECRGEQEAVYWYPCGFLVIGVSIIDGSAWIIPGDEVCPLVEDYKE